ncbi:PQQ-binding-like beta-propeller repeat protein [Gorillibacterium massiliense]|uniref:PQQ-binding-like beta-propeller repeat protein n=1 Tax=Gorillibacterium massiliense TaxID=1280390 RepID=UPI0004B4E2FC|nr:PQQ-binding-like beta-propeller repeat protein [Gorillibacterium massiliense]
MSMLMGCVGLINRVQKSKFSKMAGIVGIAAVLILSGCDKSPSGSKTTASATASLEAQTPSPSASPSSLPATASASDEKKEIFTLRSFAPFFEEPLVNGKLDNSASALYYAAGLRNEGDQPLKVIDKQQEWAEIDGIDGGWTPDWYGSDAAAKIEYTKPMRIKPKSLTELYLFPDSDTRFKVSSLPAFMQKAISSGQLITIARWNEWQAVLLPPREWVNAEKSQLNRPILLWLADYDIQPVESLDRGLFAYTSEISIDTIRQITEAAIYKGMPEESARLLLGTPTSTEASRALNSTDEPLRVGVNWRYDFPQAQFYIAIENGTVQEWHWSLPLDNPQLLHVPSVSYPYELTYSLTPLPLVPSLPAKWEWRNKGTLAYTTLIAATSDTLLLRGDDGGYSGMHENSSVYAVDKATGNTLWQINAGFGWANVSLSEDGKYANIMTAYNPELHQYESKVRRIGIRDGKPVWQYTLPEQLAVASMSAAKGTLLIALGAYDPNKGILRALDEATGTVLWEKEFDHELTVLSNNQLEETVIVRYKNELGWETLTALSPATGQTLWSKEEAMARGDTNYLDVAEPVGNPLQPITGTVQWIRLGGEYVYVDLASGEIKSRYMPMPKDRLFIIDDKHWLIERPKDQTLIPEDEKRETALVDPQTGKELWKLEGTAQVGRIEGSRLYLILNQIPTAARLSDGFILWRTSTTGLADPTRVYFSSYESGAINVFGQNLIIGSYVLNKNNGTILYRIGDYLPGYPDGRGQQIPHLLDQDPDGFFYAGSTNGYFSKFKLPN